MRKYIPQRTYENFVYPNNNVAVYDNNDVVQNIPTSGVTGTVSGFTATKVGTTMTVSFNYTWTRNGSDVFRTASDRINLFSVHMMTPSKTYYKPWRLYDVKYVTGTTQNSYTGSYTASVTQAEFGETYTDGVYTFEVRFIGGYNTFVVCQSSSIVSPSLTPTPTNTPGLSPSPTPTRSLTPTPTPTGSSGASPTPTPTMTPTPSLPSEITYYDVSGCTGGTGVIQYNGPDNFSGGEVVVSSNGNCYTIINGTPRSGPASSGIYSYEVSDCSDPAC